MDRGVKKVIKESIGKKGLKATILLTLAFGLSFFGTSKAFAIDNVLQAIQIDGVKDSYKIVLKSDDTAELKKTVQAPNKMVLNLYGIRASKSINTIYNNTASVDSVVVEPTGADSVKILIQADNVNNADIQFDTLKTPLGVLDNGSQQKATSQLELNKPMNSYSPVYNDNQEEETETSGFSATSIMGSTPVKYLKKILKSEKISWAIAAGLFAMMLMGGMKSIKGKDNEIKVGLSQSLKERDIDLYRTMGSQNPMAAASLGARQAVPPIQPQMPQFSAGANYGLKAYQNGSRNPYITPEIQRPRTNIGQNQPYFQPQAQSRNAGMSTLVQNTIQRSTQAPAVKPQTQTAPQRPSAGKTTGIDSMKFLESMTKIYEKNGRTDLAQGLKSNIKKAKMNIS